MVILKWISLFLASYLFYSSTYACHHSPVQKSKKMFDVILKDLLKTYKPAGGGGIQGIHMVSTDVFKVSILQEERIDEITYHLIVKPNCSVVIEKRSESTETKDPHLKK